LKKDYNYCNSVRKDFEMNHFNGRHFVDGKWKEYAAFSFPAINPATEEIYGLFPAASADVIEDAVNAARRAFDSWRKESRVKRSDYFDKLAQLVKRDHDKLRDAISIETGKNLNESHAEVIEALHMCQTAAASGREPYGHCVASELATKDAYVVRKPRGVVLIISPWNFPLAIGSFWCAGPALVEGNTVIHKPSELTPMVNQLVAELYEEAGFPPGVFNLVHGEGLQGAALVRSDVDVILFTGSSEVGQDIRRHCAETFSKTCSIECGSKSATMVFADGDLDIAVPATIASGFKLSGQRCVSSSRILVERSIFDQFKDRFVAKAYSLTAGDPFHPNFTTAPDYGPMISKEQMDKVLEFNHMARNDSEVTVYLGGGKTEDKGYSLRPFVYSCEWADKPFLKQEIFGPHVALIPFDTLDDAIRIYNDTDYGLALGVITNDFRKHRKIAQECTTGMLYINGGSIAAESHLPFSSWKKSGWGGSAASTWKAVTHTMSVTVNYEEGNVSWAQGMK
jgi:aldehyde dehydrogenase (NAD+)